MNVDGGPSVGRETLGRLAAAVCDVEEPTVEEVRACLAASIDQTLLDPLAGPESVARWARANAGEGFATLRVQPCNAARVAWELSELGSPTRACCVLAFPQGKDMPESVCFQVALALAAGAAELDLVMDCGAFLEGSYDDVAAPVQAALQTIDAEPDGGGSWDDDGCDHDHGCEGDFGDAGDEGSPVCHGDGCDAGGEGGPGCDCGCDCGEAQGGGPDWGHENGNGCGHDHGGGHDHECGCDRVDGCGHDREDGEATRPLLKVILETGHLTPEQVCAATDLVSSLGVDCVVAGTGFGPRGASVEDVRLMCATVEPGVQVAAAGAIRTVGEALELFEAGATRLGTPHGDEILAEFDALVATVGE